SRLLAASPLLMLGQILLLTLYLRLFVGPETAALVEIGPFLEAFLFLKVIPPAAAAGVQRLATRHRSGRAIKRVASAARVPLMMLTLAVVIASQFGGVGEELLALAVGAPIYVAFLAVIAPLGVVAGRVARLEV